jgi:hypothetical protein
MAITKNQMSIIMQIAIQTPIRTQNARLHHIPQNIDPSRLIQLDPIASLVHVETLSSSSDKLISPPLHLADPNGQLIGLPINVSQSQSCDSAGPGS